MPRSFRFDPQLERRIQEVADQKGVTASEVVRDATRKYCDEALGTTLYDAMVDLIGVYETEGGVADRAHSAFAEALDEESPR